MNIVYFPDPHNYGTHVLPRGLGSLHEGLGTSHWWNVLCTLTEGLGTSHWWNILCCDTHWGSGDISLVKHLVHTHWGSVNISLVKHLVHTHWGSGDISLVKHLVHTGHPNCAYLCSLKLCRFSVWNFINRITTPILAGVRPKRRVMYTISHQLAGSEHEWLKSS